MSGLDEVRAALLLVPYANWLGFELAEEAGAWRGVLPFREHLTGNPLVPALHGGVVAALLHFTALAELMRALEGAAGAKIFTCTIEYLASPELRDCAARAEIVTRSRRFANLRATAWQPHSGKMIAAATLQYRLRPAS